jgi:starch phosphorylase
MAYFMEIGISSSMPTYSGGLGVLAGDIVKSSADAPDGCHTSNRKGYFRQKLTPKAINHFPTNGTQLKP